MVKGRRSFFDLLPKILPSSAGGFARHFDQTTTCYQTHTWA